MSFEIASSPHLHIMLIAGESSGDALGAELLGELKKTDAAIGVSGIGGPLMIAQGLDSIYPMDDIAVMGLAQIIPRLALLKRRVDQAVSHALRSMPDAVVLIDSSGFNHPIARRLKKKGFPNPIIKYVAPQVWASRPWRAKKMAHFIDHLLALFPFEPPYFEVAGLPTTFVGHPVTMRDIVPGSGARFRASQGIEPHAPVLCLLPGSRVNEIKYLLPLFHRTVTKIAQKIPELELIIPVVSHVSEAVRTEISSWGVKTTFVDSQNVNEKFAAFDASTVALAASGTVSLELAVARVPHVIGYKVGWLTAALIRPFIKVSHATLINIMATREIVPEFIQEWCEPQAMAEVVVNYFANEQARKKHLEDVAAIVDTLRVQGSSPSERAAKTILDLIAANPALHKANHGMEKQV